MAEKKKSWFGRLFGGKKKDEPTKVNVVETAPESSTSEVEATEHEHAAISETQVVETTSEHIPETTPAAVEPPSSPEKADHIVETIVDAVKEEIHEAIAPHKKAQEAVNEETITPQHQFINDIAKEAKAEIEASHSSHTSNPDETTPVIKEALPVEDVSIIEEKTVAVEEAPASEGISEIAAIEETPRTIETPATEKEHHIVKTIVDAVNEEVQEAIVPHKKEQEATNKETIEPQHQFVTEIAQDAKAEIEAAQVVTTNNSAPVIKEAIIAEEATVTEELSITKEVSVIEEFPATEDVSETVPAAEETQEKPQKKAGFFARLSSKLSKTRNNLTEGIADLFLGKKEISEDILEELETRLLMADVGINVTDQMLTSIRDSVSRKSLSNVDELFAALKVQMKDILEPVSEPLVIDTNHKPYVILMIGVNGVGKTTTIGKLAKKFQLEGKSVMLAAGDTFRAAAVEQLEIWGERNNIPVVSQKEGADPASVIFDAMESAKAKKVDILIADTAGRLHTDSGLMQELGKINRVIKRHDETAPHEVMLVVDASTGQNALNQARQFNTTVPLSGITFTKLDGTAKGGIIFAIAEELKIPIRFIGVGESIDDLRPFNSEEFVDALISTEKAS